MKRLIALIVAAMLTGSCVAQTWMEEFQWNQLNPVGVEDWTVGGNWMPPASPPGNPNYPDDPGHMDADPDTLGSVVGANLSVALNADLDVAVPGDITIASLVLGVDNRSTRISGAGRLIFEHNEDNVVVQIPDPSPDAMPGDMVDEFTCAFNCGQSLVRSLGNGGSSNVISALVGSSQNIDFVGSQTLTLAGGFEEIPVDLLDDTVGNFTRIRSHIGSYDPSMLVEDQTRLVITGAVTTVVDNITDPFGDIEDVPLYLGSAGGSGIPEFQSASNSQVGQGYPHGVLDLPGGITGAGRVRIGTESRDLDTLPLATVALYNNSYGGGTIVDRANVILKHNNAFGTGGVRSGNPANQVGYNLIVEPGPGETAATVNRVISNRIEIPHDITVKGQHSLTLTGEYEATNSAGWVNLLPAGEKLTLTGNSFTEEDNIFTFDGSGETRVQGQLRNTGLDLTDSGILSTNNSGVIRKRGVGAVFVESSQFGHLNTFKGDSDNTSSILVEGGNLHFATVADIGGHDGIGVQQAGRIGNIQSIGGAVGLDDGTVTGPGSALFMSKLGNFADRSVPFEGDVGSFGDFDNGGLMLAASEASATLDFGAGGALENAQDMSVAAPETGLNFTGTILPGNSTYRLGGGSGTLTVTGDNKLTGANDLVVTNGSDFKNPNGNDRVRLGMVRLNGTNNYSGTTTITGKYLKTLQDQADRDSVGAGIVDRVATEEIQYNGTTLAVSSLADGNSSIGASTAASDLIIQGSTLRYEGAGESTSRLFTMGTAGATIDASGSGAIQFTNSSAIAIDSAETRTGSYDGLAFNGSQEIVYGLANTDDILIGMSIADAAGNIPANTVVTEIVSPTRVRLSNPIDVFAFETDNQITFGSVARTLSLSGSNTNNNMFAPLVTDAPDGGVVGLDKLDAGKWILQSANTYNGPTRIAGGSLIINGVQTGTGLTTVEEAGLLGGSGAIGGGLVVDGVVSPGDDGVGTFTVAGNAAFLDHWQLSNRARRLDGWNRVRSFECWRRTRRYRRHAGRIAHIRIPTKHRRYV